MENVSLLTALASVAMLALPAFADHPASIRVCISHDAVVTEPVVRLFETELGAWGPALNSNFLFECAPDPKAFRIQLVRGSSLFPPDVLGATRTRDGVPIPDVSVFCDRVIAYLGIDLQQPASRAMASVAIHEIRHVLQKRAGHAGFDIDGAVLSPAQLLLLPPRRQRDGGR